jgi:hypothetical protein
MNGNAGIGTWSPTAKLQVVGDVNIRGGLNVMTVEGTYTTFTDNTRNILVYTGASGPFIGTSTNDAFNLQTSNTNRLSIMSNGDVGIGTETPVGGLTVMNGNTGIGTWSPTSKLQVIGTVSATAFVGDGSGLTGIAAGGWTDGGANVYASSTADSVGIGTTSPQFKTHIVADDHEVLMLETTNGSSDVCDQYSKYNKPDLHGHRRRTSFGGDNRRRRYQR